MKEITLTAFSLFCTLLAYPQKNDNDFVFSRPGKPVSNSLYSNVEVIDDRHDTTNMGRIWVGLINDMNRTSPLPPASLSQQVKEVTMAAIQDPIENGSLLIHLRFFKFSDINSWPQQQCFCFFRAGLYEKCPGGYKRICSIDTTLSFPVPRRLQSAREIFSESGFIISQLIFNNLDKHSNSTELVTMPDIRNIDSLEKRNIPLYNTLHFQDGVYQNYTSFKLQKPDYAIASLDSGDGKISKLKIVNEKGKKIPADPENTYAVIYNNNIYIRFEKSFTPAVKIGDDFYLTAKVTTVEKNSTGRNVGNVLLDAPGYVFSPLGPLRALGTADRLAANKHTAHRTFEMKIDHIDGLPIKLKEIEGSEKQTPGISKEDAGATTEQTTAPEQATESQEENKKNENNHEPQQLNPF